MSDWTEAAVDTAIRAAARGRPDISVRVSAPVHAELARLQQEFAVAHPGGSITMDGVIAGLLAVAKAARP